MRTLRWIVPLIVVLLAAVLWLPIAGHGRWYAVVLNVGHGVVFAIVAVLCKISLRSIVRSGGVARYAAAFGIAVALGALVEVLQLPMGRDADPWDVGRDALGAWAGLALLAALDAKAAARPRLPAVLSFVVPVAILAVPVVECANAYLRRSADFPVLADFSRSGDDYFIELLQAAVLREELAAPWSQAAGERALRVRFIGGPYAGVDFAEPVADWTAYGELAIDLTNPNSAPLPLGLRVHDGMHDHRYEDRYNATFVLAPGRRTTLAIPLDEIRRGPRDRSLDMARIADFMLFVSLAEMPDAPRSELFISRIWLR